MQMCGVGVDGDGNGQVETDGSGCEKYSLRINSYEEKPHTY